MRLSSIYAVALMEAASASAFPTGGGLSNSERERIRQKRDAKPVIEPETETRQMRRARERQEAKRARTGGKQWPRI